MKRAVRARRRRRRALRAAAASAPVLLVAAAALLITPTPTPLSPADPPPGVAETPTRGANAPEPPALAYVSFSTVGDDELLELLRNAGYDAGIARLGSRVVVTGLPPQAGPEPDDTGPGARSTPETNPRRAGHSA